MRGIFLTMFQCFGEAISFYSHAILGTLDKRRKSGKDRSMLRGSKWGILSPLNLGVAIEWIKFFLS